MVARKDKWSFEELMGSMVVGDKIGLDVVLTSGLFPVIRVNLPQLMKILGRVFMTVEFPLEDLCLGSKENSEITSPCITIFCKSIRLPKWHYW